MEREQLVAFATILLPAVALTVIAFATPLWLHLAIAGAQPLLLLGASALLGFGVITAIVSYALVAR